MKQLTCEMCGSTDMMKQDGVFICQTCGMKYSVEEAKKMMIEGIVEVKVNQSDNVKILLKRGFNFLKESRFQDAIAYSERILDIDPENGQAYLINLMGHNNMSCENDWSRVYISKNDPNLRNILKYGDDVLKEQIKSYYKLIASPFIINDGVLYDFVNTGYDTEIIIPESVTTIDRNVFSECRSLTKVVIPNSVTKIDENAFFNCTSLVSVVIPGSVARIEKHAFYGCRMITELKIEDGVRYIGEEAFSDCRGLTNIVIPKSVMTIDRRAFWFCTNLETVTIKSKSTLLVERAFDYCDKLKQITKGDDPNFLKKINQPKRSGCYVATCVYGSYDCPQVWTLRRYRDDTLGSTWYGRLFIRTYYAISPTLVKWFGNTNWFKKLWKGKLDRMVAKLQSNGVEDTPYEDKNW